MIRMFSDVHSPYSWFDPRPAAAEIGVREVDGALELSIDLPGVALKDVEITLDGPILSLVAKREFTLRDGQKEVRELARRFRLPAKVDAERTTATLKDGVLTVRLAKHEVASTRQITVTAA